MSPSVVAALVVVSVTLSAQQASQTAVVRAIFEVRDERGQPVTDLTASDFHIYQSGVEHFIEAFKAPPPLPPTDAPKAAGIAVMLLVDDLNMPRDQIPGTISLIERIRDILLDGDLVGIVSTGQSSINVDLGDDRGHGRINDAIQKLRRPLQAPAPPVTGLSEVEARHRAHAALHTAADILLRFGQLPDRQKSLVFISGTVPVDPFKGRSLARAREETARSTPLGDIVHQPGTEISDDDLGTDTAALMRHAVRTDADVIVLHASDGAFEIIPAGTNVDFPRPGSGLSQFSTVRRQDGVGVAVLPRLSEDSGIAWLKTRLRSRSAPRRPPNEEYYTLEYISRQPALATTQNVTIQVSRPRVTVRIRAVLR